jgi:hypothetical protein
MSFVENVLVKKGGDTTIRDISRYGRMPCGINNKKLADGMLKYPKEFRVNKVAADYELRYSITQIAAAFKFVIVVPEKPVRDRNLDVLVDSDAVWFAMAIDICNATRMGEGSGGGWL